MAIDLEKLHEIRLHELAETVSLLPATGRILELGAGTGFQANELRRMGYSVTALDISPYDEATSEYAAGRVFPVETYDGDKIPYGDGHFDVVYSSNLMEHVRDTVNFLRESARVLPPGGRIVMVVPTTAWRFWSMAAHYAARGRSALRRLGGTPRGSEDSTTESGSFGSYSERIHWILVPPPHGEVGSALTELVTYSRWGWRKVMRDAGLVVADEKPLGVFNTGEYLSRFSIRQRILVARFAGSASRAYLAFKA